MRGIVNWELIQKRSMPPMPRNEKMDPATMWGKSAVMYNGMARLEREYTKKQIAVMQLSKEDTFLDIGCGPGRLSVPIAKQVKKVTSLDVAPEMLAFCKKNAEQAGADNLETRLLNWETAEIGRDIEQHDIVLASRSVGFQDLIKLNSVAKKRAYILCWANGPSLKEIFDDLFFGVDEGIQPRHMVQDRNFGYNIMFNMVYDLGFDPNIRIVEDGFEGVYDSREAAYEDLRTLNPFAEEKMPIFRKNVDRYLTEENGKIRFYRGTKTYVLWWDTKPIDLDYLEK